jgi:hypothetical protein
VSPTLQALDDLVPAFHFASGASLSAIDATELPLRDYPGAKGLASSKPCVVRLELLEPVGLDLMCRDLCAMLPRPCRSLA